MPLVSASKKLIQFDPKTFLSTVDGGRKIAVFSNKQTIFVQGDSSDAVFYIQKGKVKLTVVSQIGKEATIGILNEGDFFGEGCLTGHLLRMCSATAMTDCSVMRIEKKSMMEVLHREHAFSDMFVAYLLARNIRYEEDLVDQLFNSSEKRLARPAGGDQGPRRTLVEYQRTRYANERTLLAICRSVCSASADRTASDHEGDGSRGRVLEKGHSIETASQNAVFDRRVCHCSG
jgi:CRP-like cAMP-binding protein